MIVVTPPEKIAFARDRVVWKFKDDGSDQLAPGVAANVLKFTGAVPHGTQLVLRWQNGDLRLRASDNPDNSGAEFPSGDGGLTYVQELAQWFEKNYYISEDFTVTQASYESQPSIYLYARRGGTAYSMAPTTFTGGSVIRYASGSDGKTRVNNSVFVEVKVRADNAWDYITAYKGVLPLDDARTASLDVGEILAAYLKNELPTFGLPEATKLIFSCRDYYIRYAHAGGEPFSIGQVETTEKYNITTGGHSTMGAENRSVETTLKGATAAQDKFLTLQDRTRFVRVDESLYLSYINLRTARTWIAAQATVTYEDDTTTTTNTNVINNVQPYEKIRFGVGYPQFNLGAFPKRVKEYSVKLIDNSGATISESIRCIVDYSHREYIRYMAYFNSHGGVELLKTYGKASSEFRISKEVAERVLPDMFGAREPQFINWGATLTEIVEVASGFIPHRQLGHFLDFFLSDQQYRVANNTAYPIIVNTDEVKKGTDGENFSAIVFQFRYARHTDSVGAADLDRLSDTFAITPGVQVAGEVLLNAPGGEWSGIIDPFPVSGSDNPVASGGVWSMLQSYQPLITTGNITQYFRGDFSLGDLTTDVPANETDPTVPDFAKTLNNLSTLLTLLKTVDGEGSGLDADLWQGKTPEEIIVGKASTWETPRTLSLTGAVTGSVDVDGSGDMSLETTVNHTHTWESITAKPTTSVGAGLTDVVKIGGNQIGSDLAIGTIDNYSLLFKIGNANVAQLHAPTSGYYAFTIGDNGLNYARIAYDGIRFVGGHFTDEYDIRIYHEGDLGYHELFIRNDSAPIHIHSGESINFYVNNDLKFYIESSTFTVLSRIFIYPGAGNPPIVTASRVLNANFNADLLDGEEGAWYRNRDNHTGTQLSETISDFQEAVLDTTLTGYALGATEELAEEDTLLEALAKLQAQVSTKIGANAGSEHRVVKFGTDGAVLVDSAIYSVGLNVGIGVESPSERLEVDGRVKIVGDDVALSFLYDDEDAIEMLIAGNETQIFFKNTVTNSIPFQVDLGAADNTFRIFANGNVGIGVSGTASYKLTVAGNVYVIGRIISPVVTGSGLSPFVVSSTVLNSNLNADLLDGLHASAFARKSENEEITGEWTFPGFLLTDDAVIGSALPSGIINIGTDNNTAEVNIGRVGGTVNIYGTVNSQNTTDLEVTNKTILLNDGGAASSGFSSGILIEEADTVVASILTNASRNGWEFKAPAVSYKATFLLSELSTHRSYTLPNASGTIALQSWVSSQLENYSVSGHKHTIADIDDFTTDLVLILATLKTTVIPEGDNKYFTEARVLNTKLTSFEVGENSPVTSTDTVFSAIAKLQRQLNEKGSAFSGTAGYLAKFTASGAGLANSLVFSSASTVGIGTNNPNSDFLLDIRGRTRIGQNPITGAFSFTDIQHTSATIAYNFHGGEGGEAFAAIRASATYKTLGFFTIESGNATRRFIILPDGKIGIGIDTPEEVLQVQGNIRASGKLISYMADGTAPLEVLSKTMVPNLNADLWRGKTPDNITVWKSTKWAEKRIITVGGAVTGAVELDGSENVTLTLEKNFDIIGELTFTGDVTGTGTGEIELSLNEIIDEGTYTKVTVNKKGLVTEGAALEASDIPSLLASKISNFAASVRATALTGISIPGTPTLVSEGQSILEGIAALQSQINSFSTGTPNKVPVANSNGLFVDSIISSSANRVSIGEGTESGSWMLYVEGNIITKGILASTIADGTAPLSVASKTMVPNLNAHMLGGHEANYFLNASNIHFGQLSPDVLAPTGVESGRYSVVTVDEKGRVVEGRQLTYGDIAHALPDANKYDPRGPRFHRFSRVYIEECAEIDPPIVFDYATKISSHHLPSDLSVKFIVKNFKSQGIEVANSGLVITLTGMPEFTFDADEIAVVFEDTEGNQRIVPLDVSVVPAENNVPACPVGYPTIVDIVEASTTGMRPEINYSTIEKLRWRVKQSGQVVAQGTLFTADIPSPVNQPWIPFPAPLAAGAYVFEIEGESCSSSVASKSFTITVPSTNYSIVPKYYDLTSGTPVYVMDITPGAILPWKAKYNIKAEISGLHNQVAMSLTTAGTNQMSWGPENIEPGGASTNNSAPWIFGPAGHSNGRPAGQATIRTRAYLQNVLVEDVSISFTLQESVPSTGTNFYFGTHFVDGEDETLVNEVQMTENGTYQLPQAPSLYGLRIDHVVGNWMSYYEIYMEVLVSGQWQALRVAGAPNHQPYIKAGAIEDTALSFVFSIPTTLINNATGQVFNPHQPGAYRVSIAGTHEGVVVGSSVVTYNLTQNNSPTGLLPNPGVEQVTIGDTLYEMIGDGQAYFEVLPDGKVKIHAPVTKPSFDSARSCNRFLHGGNNSEKIDDADAAALFGSGLLLPPGLHSFVIHYYAAESMDEVYDDPWKFAIEENPESAGYCAAMHTLDIFIYSNSTPAIPSP